jgi:hypothetical protein
MRHMPEGPLVSLVIVVCVVAFDIVCKTEILEPQRKDNDHHFKIQNQTGVCTTRS